MNIQSEGADLKGGVAIGECKSGIYFGELATTKKAIAVGQLGIVLEAPLLRPIFSRRVDSGGGLRPFFDRLGEAVVHGEGEDTCIGMEAATKGEEEEKEDGDEADDSTETEHFL